MDADQGAGPRLAAPSCLGPTQLFLEVGCLITSWFPGPAAPVKGLGQEEAEW